MWIWIIASPFILYMIGNVSQNILYVVNYIDIVYVPFGFMCILLLLGIYFLKKIEQMNWISFLVLFVFIWIPIDAMATYRAREYIAKFAMERYHKKPEYIEIAFEYEYRKPHAILLKDGKAYYWSFKKRDFIEDQNIRSWL